MNQENSFTKMFAETFHGTKKRRTFGIAAVIFLLSACLALTSGCGQERIGITGGETGEYYGTEKTGKSGTDQANAQNEPSTPAKQAAVQEQFSDFCLRLFCDEVGRNTLDLHYTLKHPETWGIEAGEPTLGTVSLTEMISDTADAKKLKGELLAFDRSVLTEGQKLVYDVLLENLETTAMQDGLELYDQPLAPTIGVQAQLPILLSEYSFSSLKDIEDYLAILSQIDSYYGQILEFEKQKADAGLAPSDASIDGIIESCQSYLIDPENNFLTETFASRLETVPSLTEDQKIELSSRHTAVIREHFIPAYQLLIDGMEAFRGKGIHDGGLADLKNGKKYYEYLLKAGPGTSYTVQELKEALIDRMEQDLDIISGIVTDSPDFRPDAASFSLTEPAEILEDLRVQMKQDFPELPGCSYDIKYVPKYLEDSLSPAFYLTAPIDDLDHNVIYINRGSPDSNEGLYTTLAHEGFPGHLYQTVYARSHTSDPILSLLSNSGANEGWATYVENYACNFDNGLPENVGTYRACLRSFSLCVHGLLDIGINYDGWTMEQAKEFITTYFNADDDTVKRLWQTMIDNPTNYLDYCNGYVELMEMRAEAEKKLKARFSPMEFHQFILDMGPVPYSVLRPYFDEWLKKQ